MLELAATTGAIALIHVTGQGGKSSLVGYGPVAMAYLLWACLIAFKAIESRQEELAFISDNPLASLVVSIALIVALFSVGRGITAHVLYVAIVVMVAIQMSAAVNRRLARDHIEDTDSVRTAAIATVAIFTVAAVGGLLYPKAAASLQPLLTRLLLCLIVVTAVMLLLGVKSWLLFAVPLGLFALLIASDVATLALSSAGRAAADISFPHDILGLFLDVVNVFTNVLGLSD